jgi:hypothetical protein
MALQPKVKRGCCRFLIKATYIEKAIGKFDSDDQAKKNKAKADKKKNKKKLKLKYENPYNEEALSEEDNIYEIDEGYADDDLFK